VTSEIPVSCNAPSPRACDPDSVRCLIVDDSTRFLEAACTLLEREGIAVVGVASTSAEALERAHELEPDVVLLDIILGRESGFDLARRLTADGRGACRRVILISTHPEDEFADLIEASPAVGFLPKSQLSGSAIREILGERDDAAAAAESPR
jgi:two-component system nitrate/nitrite response regulator NarL